MGTRASLTLGVCRLALWEPSETGLAFVLVSVSVPSLGVVAASSTVSFSAYERGK